MTNKQVISLLKKENLLSAPDLWPSLENIPITAAVPDKTVRPRRKWQVALAACTASALAVGVIAVSLSGLWNTSHQPVPPLNDTAPGWYLPSRLTATTLTYQNQQQTTAKFAPATTPLTTGLSEKSQISPLSTTDKNIVLEASPQTPISRSINAQVVDISAEIQAPEHKSCSGLFFDTKAQQVICISHIAKEAMQLAETEQVYLDEYGANLDYAAYTVSSTGKSYVINIRTKQYRQLPVSLTGKTLSISASADYRYLLFGKPGAKDSSVDDVLMIDLRDMTCKNIAENYPAYMFSILSADGQFACFSIRDQNGVLPESVDGKWVIYAVQTGAYHEVTGEFLQFLPNNDIVFQTKSGYLLYDSHSGSPVSSYDGEKHHTYLISDTVAQDDISRNVLRTDLTSNKQQQIFPKPVSIYTISRDSRYLYTYTLGDQSIICVNIETLEQFSVPISEEFVRQTTALSKDNRIIFQLSVNENATELLLCFYTIPNAGPMKPETPPVSEIPENPPIVKEFWDVIEQSAESTINQFSNITAVVGEENTTLFPTDVKTASKLIELLNIVKGLEYKKANAAGLPGVSACETAYALYLSNETLTMDEMICISYTPDGRYLVHILYNMERYSMISKEVYDKLCDLCEQMINRSKESVSSSPADFGGNYSQPDSNDYCSQPEDHGYSSYNDCYSRDN